MTFSELIGRMADAAARGDGQAVADCFTADGVYDDVFYGPFQGDAIKDMIENYFHRDGCNFRWDMHDAVDNGSDDLILDTIDGKTLKAGQIAKQISNVARKQSQSKEAATPYAQQAKKRGLPEYQFGIGGKVDDIGCVVVVCK